MSDYTKKRVTMQYTEIVYMRDGEDFASEEIYDAHAYDEGSPEPMSEQEIEDWA